MKKQKRSQQKRITLENKILRYMRMSKGISMREAGRISGCSDSAISHYEQGRMDISPSRIATLVQAYGYSLQDWEEYKAGKPIPVLSIQDECAALLKRLDDQQLKAVHGLLTGFIR